jgi:hypothetical protein
MTPITVTAEQRDLIAAGTRHLVIEGVVSVSTARPLWPGSNLPGVDTVPPQQWVDATGPCPTCNGSGDRYWKGSGTGCPNPDCIDGRKRVALAVEPPHTHDKFCRGLDCIEHPVVFAHATLEVQPVTEHPPPGQLGIVPVPGRDFVVILDNVELMS